MYLKLNKAISCILCLGRDIYYAKYYGGVGGGEWSLEKKNKKQGLWEKNESQKQG